jgi:SAM-dependent methyltransferase
MFPDAEVVGSDLSAASLEMAERNARGLGVSNLTLRGESIFGAAYEGEFDYVVCTGVVHHTADPPAAVARLAAALRPGGVMQLMVYNRYHRAMTTAFQKAVRAMLGDGGYAYERELALARRFVDHYAGAGEVAGWLAAQRDRPDAYLADALIQPVEHSYTVQSLAHLAAGAGLELLAPCPNAHDAASGTLHWEMEMGDAELQRAYDALPDLQRWQVTNLLLQERSPMLWFYLQRADSPHPRLTTRDRCAAFLERRFAATRTVRRVHLAGPGDGAYRPAPDREVPFPARPRSGDVQRVVEAVDPGAPLRETLRRLGIPTADVRAVDRLRVLVASTAFPYLRAA